MMFRSIFIGTSLLILFTFCKGFTSNTKFLTSTKNNKKYIATRFSTSSSDDTIKISMDLLAQSKIIAGTSLGLLTAATVLLPAFPANAGEKLVPILSSVDTGIWRFFLSGGICAAFSHAVVVPLDVIKTRLQFEPVTDGNSIGAVGIVKRIVKEEGAGMLLKGFGPTLTGYFVQGSLKYGFYDIFKRFLRPLLESSYHLDLDTIQGKLILFAMAGIMADSIGSVALSPFEAARIRLVANPTFAKGVISTMSKISDEEGVQVLFNGLPSILCRQLPFTSVQLSSFEIVTTVVYCRMFDSGMSFTEMDGYKFYVSVSAACVAAVLAVLASQPGDALLSQVNKDATAQLSQEGRTVGGIELTQQAFNELGIAGLFRGIQTRFVQITVMVVVQLVTYDFVKQLVGIPATGLH